MVNPDNLFGSAGVSMDGVPFLKDIEGNRKPFVNRPTKGKTARKRRFPPTGKKTNVGDPMLNQSIGKGRK